MITKITFDEYLNYVGRTYTAEGIILDREAKACYKYLIENTKNDKQRYKILKRVEDFNKDKDELIYVNIVKLIDKYNVSNFIKVDISNIKLIKQFIEQELIG